MADDDQIKRLELRIQELEKQLPGGQAAPTVSDLSADEIKAFLKVRDVLAVDWGEFCGINDCFRCRVVGGGAGGVVVNPRACVVECSCGPCNVFGGPMVGGFGRFSGLGG